MSHTEKHLGYQYYPDPFECQKSPCLTLTDEQYEGERKGFRFPFYMWYDSQADLWVDHSLLKSHPNFKGSLSNESNESVSRVTWQQNKSLSLNIAHCNQRSRYREILVHIFVQVQVGEFFIFILL